MSRKWAREKAMTLIYQADVNGVKAKETLENFFEHEEQEIQGDDREYIVNCVSGVEEAQEEIIPLIEKHLKNWKLGRVAKVDLAILKLSMYEMLKREDVPNAVSVNEAIELAKKFGGENSASFVNGVLGNAIKEIKTDDKDIRD